MNKELMVVLLVVIIGVVLISFYRKWQFKTEETKTNETALTWEQIEPAISAFSKETELACINLKAVQQVGTEHPISVFGSKLGGVPYLPPNFDYPFYNDINGAEKPLKLLAQINFTEMPELKDFPQKGILQFYIAPNDILGVNFDELTNQNGFRVVYHTDIISDESLLRQPPEFAQSDDECFPFAGEFALVPEKSVMSMPPSDFRFNDLFMEYCREATNSQENSLWNLDSGVLDKIHETFQSTGHRIGGYPFFTQTDPREYEEKLQEHTILLFQIDSEMIGDKYEIIWGDCGVANFFIKPSDLRNLDFSDIIYTWDCY